MSLPGSSQDAVSDDKKNDCINTGRAIGISLKKILNPLTLCPRRIENAITVVIVRRINQCSTSSYCDGEVINADLDLDDFTRIGKRVPVLVDIKPFGKNYMSSLNEVGGIQPLMKMLLDADLLHGDCLFQENYFRKSFRS